MRVKAIFLFHVQVGKRGVGSGGREMERYYRDFSLVFLMLIFLHQDVPLKLGVERIKGNKFKK